LSALSRFTERFSETWRASWPWTRQALQTALAACLSYALADVLGLPQGFWAVVTAITVMQANVGASLGQAVDRLLGSLIGVLVGGAIAVILADSHALRYAGLAVAVLILAFVSAKRPPLRIACVTAAIVILGDPSVSPPLQSAAYRMIEVMMGALIASATSLLVFPSRAGPALSRHVAQTLPLYYEALRQGLGAALGDKEDDFSIVGGKIRAALATSATLASQAKLELAGYLARYPDSDALMRTLRRLWHTEIMLLRAVASPLPAPALAAIRPQLEQALAAAAALTGCAAKTETVPDMQALDSALRETEGALTGFRVRGGLRSLAMEDVARLMTFDFALGQLRSNFADLRERGRDLEEFAGSMALAPASSLPGTAVAGETARLQPIKVAAASDLMTPPADRVIIGSEPGTWRRAGT
jgi:uncharacterized membrane protein YccC